MSLYRPSDLLQFLDEYQLRPNKRLSQNFLIDQNILDKMIALTKLKKNQPVLEIGPGPGGLTQKLLQAQAKVIAIEKDHGFANALKRLESLGDLQIINRDVLEVDLKKSIPTKSIVIANLPYNITSKVIAQILDCNHIDSAIVMVQKEIAQRMIAKPGSKEYSHLSLYMQLYSTVKLAFLVKPTSFFPKPKVESAIVQFFPQKQTLSPPFFELTKKAFSQKRKMLKGSLSSLYEKQAVEDALSTLKKEPSARPQDLSPQEFVQLFDLLQMEKPSKPKKEN